MSEPKPFIPRDKPKSWVVGILAGLVGLAVGLVGFAAACCACSCRGACGRYPVSLASREHRPDNAGVLRGQCHRRTLVAASGDQFAQPATGRSCLSLNAASTARVPWISNMRRYLSPCLVMRPSRVLPPVLYCRGTRPSWPGQFPR